MITTINAPQVDVNDGFITITELNVKIGDAVKEQDELATAETLKTVVAVHSTTSGYVREVLVAVGQEVKIGALMFVLADTMEEELPSRQSGSSRASNNAEGNGNIQASQEVQISAKASLLARNNGIDIAALTPVDGRIRVEDVQAAIDAVVRSGTVASPKPAPAASPSSGTGFPPLTKLDLQLSRRDLGKTELGTIATLNWSKNNANPAYLETVIDLAPLKARAKTLREEHKWIFDPLFGLLAWHYVQFAKKNPELASTCDGKTMVQFEDINLGFTIDVRGTLYLIVLRKAGEFEQKKFLEALFSLQRKAKKGKLSAEEQFGSTLGITSLSSFGVTKHQPILPPYTSVMLAHSDPLPFSPEGTDWTVIGATYDHRVHNGARMADMLNHLGKAVANA